MILSVSDVQPEGAGRVAAGPGPGTSCHDSIPFHLEGAQEGRQHPLPSRRANRAGSTIPPCVRRSRSIRSASSACGVIRSQSEAQRSAPNTAMLRRASQRSTSGVSAKPGNRKKGTRGSSDAPAVGGEIVRLETAIDVGFRGRRAHPAQGDGGVRIGVVADRVVRRDLAADEPGKGRRIAADQEEGGLNAHSSRRASRTAGVRRRLRTIVEGKRHLVIAERKSLRIGLQPERRPALRPDRLDPAGAERFLGTISSWRASAACATPLKVPQKKKRDTGTTMGG